ncbi:UDP-N-acetylglucosamine transferase subunit ALG14 homolog [Bolinopsis microptera]|uniref:UDP-N-acetylglucosamine transferase subunit ALG14 homolog n=1 Tax=Bolinopsis microptera TaxID=2820187 RepID=UPI00307B074C
MLFVVLFTRLLYVLFQIHYNDTPPFLPSLPSQPVRLLTVAGSGGHTAELLQLLTAATTAPSSKTPSVNYNPRHYIVADTDKMSHNKIELFEAGYRRQVPEGYLGRIPGQSVVISKIPRAREVGQSYVSSVLTTLYSQLLCVPHVVHARPDVLLVNGPGTCIPVCVMVFLLRVLGVCKGRIVYVESICRVKTLSLSAKILVLFADHVLVQWSHLAEGNFRCKYIGRLVS